MCQDVVVLIISAKDLWRYCDHTCLLVRWFFVCLSAFSQKIQVHFHKLGKNVRSDRSKNLLTFEMVTVKVQGQNCYIENLQIMIARP